MMRRLLWLAWWAAFAFVLLVLACVPAAVTAAWSRPVKPWSGNRGSAEHERVAAKIAVFGDTQKGLAGFEALAGHAKAEGVGLAIHTGDLVSQADVGHYDLALKWVQKSFPQGGIPFVVVPGNHDIKGAPNLFEERIGPRQFAFPWGPVEIVGVDNAVGPPDEAAVEALLKNLPVRPILLCMHVPPIDPARNIPKPEYERFLRMIRSYPVTHVFSGHAHAYSKTKLDGLTFISNGVGGDSDSWQFDQKAYLTIVEATPDGIATREISIDPVFSVRANFEHLAIGHVGEILIRTWWGTPAFLVLILLLVWVARRLRGKKRVEPTDPPQFKFTPAKASDPPDVVI